MRTTVTLDEDLAARLRGMAAERGISFKEALNAALRAGLVAQAGSPRPYRAPVRSLGLRAGIDIDSALRLASALEDEETVRKLNLRK